MKNSIVRLIDERNKLVNSDKTANASQISSLDTKIAEEEAEVSREKIMKHFKELSDNPENVNLQQMWKLCKKIWPKSGSTLPTAKRNKMGKIVSGPRDIRNVLSKEYKDRLRTRPIRPDLKAMVKRKKVIFKMKMKLAQSNPSSEWCMADLDRALSNLKNNKSRDSEGLINEIFKKGVIGLDLKKSLLIMCNKIKLEKMIPKFMNVANVTTVPKKGSRIEPEN